MFWKIFHYFQGISFSLLAKKKIKKNSFSTFVADKAILSLFSAFKDRMQHDVV